jgi:hypothetical protein
VAEKMEQTVPKLKLKSGSGLFEKGFIAFRFCSDFFWQLKFFC